MDNFGVVLWIKLKHAFARFTQVKQNVNYQTIQNIQKIRIIRVFTEVECKAQILDRSQKVGVICITHFIFMHDGGGFQNFLTILKIFFA